MVQLEDLLTYRTRQQDAAVVVALALGAAVIAALASGEPTGLVLWDAVLKASLAAAVVIAASKAPRWVVIVLTSAAAAFAGVTVWGLVGFVSLILAAASTLLPKRNRLVGSMAAALATQSLLRLPSMGFFGLPSLIAGILFVLVLVSGFRYGTRSARRWVRIGAALSSVAVMVIVLAGGVSLINARSDADVGVAAARRGLAAARSGETTAIVQELERAESALTRANSRMGGLAARSLQLLPIAAQHHRAIESATSAGAQVARSAAATVRDADIESISLTAGAIDLSQLGAMAPQLRSTEAALQAAIVSIEEADSPWIVSPVRSRVRELSVEVQDLLPEIQLAAEAAEVVPSMLGADGTTTYFTFFGTPAESREFGGFIGSWALLTFDNGRVELGESGRIGELYSIAEAATIDPETVSEWYLSMARPTQFPQNLTSSPDMLQVAEASRQVLGAVSDAPIDGFIYIDAHALIDILEITGPVQTPFQDAPLTVQNAATFFFADQYRIEGTRTEIFDTMWQVTGTIVERVRQQTLPGPQELGRILGPAARAGHLQVATFDEKQNDFLRSTRLLRDFERAQTSDFVGLVQTNGLSNKMDLYLERTLEYRADIGADGSMNVIATVTLESIVPLDAPPFALGAGDQAGQNHVILSLYTPLQLTGVSRDGAPIDSVSAVEFAMARHLVEVTIMPNAGPTVLEFDLTGQQAPETPYSLEVWHQPLVNSDQVTVLVATPENTVEWAGTLVENLILEALPK